MTTVYFVRHAESDHGAGNERSRGLSKRGMRDRERVTQYLSDKGIQMVFSSPYRRAVDTVSDMADREGLPICCIEDFREWYRCADPTMDFQMFCRRHWEDFDERYADGESLREVQARNIQALGEILQSCAGQTVVIGTHGMALSTVINFYDRTFGYGDFLHLLPRLPLIVKMTFDGMSCLSVEQIEVI